jgi:hypothetical protein
MALFALVILGLYPQASLDHTPPIVLHCIVGMIGAYYCAQSLFEMGSRERFAQLGLGPKSF